MFDPLLKSTLIAFIFLFVLACSQRKATTDFSFRAIDSLLKIENKANRFHGSVSIGVDTGIAYTLTLGLANRETETRLTNGHLFDIASLNKSFIATLTVIAHNEGRLNLQDKLVDLIGGFAYTGQFDSTISLHQLLTHASGLPDYEAVPDTLKVNEYEGFKLMHFSNEEYVDFISQLPEKGRPDQQFYYSNFAYHLVAIILESSYECSFNSLLQKKICEPLGLKHTLNVADNQKLNNLSLSLALGYQIQPSGEWKPNPHIDLTLGRRIFSNTHDLCKWAMAQHDTSWLSKSSLNILHKIHTAHLPNAWPYGYGWVIHTEHDDEPIGNLDLPMAYVLHGGQTDGYKALLMTTKTQKPISIALLTNSGNQVNELQLVKRIAQLLKSQLHEN